ncbi:hypothetical protein, partial [Pseudonocardia pini]|uniref:hypothetical protein n=1 Tax=Pseudonocardia pini TaxID=2758030 RepID=UPI001C68D7B2
MPDTAPGTAPAGPWLEYDEEPAAGYVPGSWQDDLPSDPFPQVEETFTAPVPVVRDWFAEDAPTGGMPRVEPA